MKNKNLFIISRKKTAYLLLSLLLCFTVFAVKSTSFAEDDNYFDLDETHGMIVFPYDGNAMLDNLKYDGVPALGSRIASNADQIFDIEVEHMINNMNKRILRNFYESLKSNDVVMIWRNCDEDKYYYSEPSSTEPLTIGYGIVSNEGVKIWQKAEWIIKKVLPRKFINEMMIDNRIVPDQYKSWIKEHYTELTWDSTKRQFFLRKKYEKFDFNTENLLKFNSTMIIKKKIEGEEKTWNKFNGDIVIFSPNDSCRVEIRDDEVVRLQQNQALIVRTKVYFKIHSQEKSLVLLIK